MSDVFDNAVPPQWRADLFVVIRQCSGLDFLVLTKRPQNIPKMLPSDWGDGYANVWLGATCEDQKSYDQRWPILDGIPATIRFISYEPAIGPLLMPGPHFPDWLICGGESGHGVRIMNPQWARVVRDQCRREGIAFFMKQWGTAKSNPLVFEKGLSASAVADDPYGKGGAILDGLLHREFPA